MTDEFNRRWELYEKGELPPDEIEEFEQELEKIEHSKESKLSSKLNTKKKRTILQRSKWIARIQTAFSALAIFLVFMIVTSILSGIYYGFGENSKGDTLRNVVEYSSIVTDPYGQYSGTSMNGKTLFRMELTRDINKRVGSEFFNVGQMNVNFLFSMMNYPETTEIGRTNQNVARFSHPSFLKKFEDDSKYEWNRLEKLPEGTVASAFITFDELYSTEKVFEMFEGQNLDIIWLPVEYTESTDINYEYSPFERELLGFPNFPIFHDDDMILESREVEKGFFGSKTISEGHSSPAYEEGDADMLHTQFLKTLKYLEPHQKKFEKFLFGKVDLATAINYMETNGISHYGVVVTGPTKELLALKEEDWIGMIQIDEVAFWNWTDY